MRKLVRTCFMAAILAAFVTAAASAADAPAVDATECGMFTVSPEAGAVGLRPVRLIRVDYVTCFPGGTGGVGVVVDGEVPDYGVLFNDIPAVMSVAVVYERQPLLPGEHTVIATAGERMCETCPWVHRTVEWTFTVGHAHKSH